MPIRSYLLLPRGYSTAAAVQRHYPLMLYLHGRGGKENHTYDDKSFFQTYGASTQCARVHAHSRTAHITAPTCANPPARAHANTRAHTHTHSLNTRTDFLHQSINAFTVKQTQQGREKAGRLICAVRAAGLIDDVIILVPDGKTHLWIDSYVCAAAARAHCAPGTATTSPYPRPHTPHARERALALSPPRTQLI